MVTHSFSATDDESRICWRLGWFSALCALFALLAVWLEANRYVERYDLGWLLLALFIPALLGFLASFAAMMAGAAELFLWVFRRKLQPSCWRTLAGLCLACLLPLLMIPRVVAPSKVALRTTDMNSLRQLALASHNFESARGYLPLMSGDTEGTDARGQGLSWRVHILPFLDEAELYEQFRLDESWDSPHNQALLIKMPAAYESRWPYNSPAEGYTLFQRPLGHGAIDPGDGKESGSAR